MPTYGLGCGTPPSTLEMFQKFRIAPYILYRAESIVEADKRASAGLGDRGARMRVLGEGGERAALFGVPNLSGWTPTSGMVLGAGRGVARSE